MSNRNAILFLVSLVISGCITRASEQPFIAGTWEGTGESYAMFEYVDADDAHLVLAVLGGSESITTVRLSNFEFYEEQIQGEIERTFRSIGTYETDKGTQRLDFSGLIRGNTMILVWEEASLDDEDFEVDDSQHTLVFTRSEILDASRTVAKESLDTYRSQTSGTTDNPVITGTWEATGEYYYHLPYGRFEYANANDAHMVLVDLGAPAGSEQVGIVRLSNFAFGDGEFDADFKTVLEAMFGESDGEFSCTGTYEHERGTNMSKCRGLIHDNIMILAWTMPIGDDAASERQYNLVFVRSEAFDVLHMSALKAIDTDRSGSRVEE